MNTSKKIYPLPKRNNKKLNPFLTFGIFMIIIIILSSSGYFIYQKILKERHPQFFTESVNKYSQLYGVEEELIYAVIKTESGFREKIVSSAGAQGLMQIMPDTKDWIEFRLGINDEMDIFDPEINIRYGAFLLSYLSEKFGDEVCMLAAYNAGSTSVSRWLSDTRYSDDGKTLKAIPYGETEKYVKKVDDAKKIYKKLYYKNKS